MSSQKKKIYIICGCQYNICVKYADIINGGPTTHAIGPCKMGEDMSDPDILEQNVFI